MAFGDKTFGFESLKMNLKLARENINKRRERKTIKIVKANFEYTRNGGYIIIS